MFSFNQQYSDFKSQYYSGRDNAIRNIVKRYARGNVTLQQGLYITAEQLRERSLQADKALLQIEKKLQVG